MITRRSILQLILSLPFFSRFKPKPESVVVLGYCLTPNENGLHHFWSMKSGKCFMGELSMEWIEKHSVENMSPEQLSDIFGGSNDY